MCTLDVIAVFLSSLKAAHCPADLGWMSSSASMYSEVLKCCYGRAKKLPRRTFLVAGESRFVTNLRLA